VTICRFGSLLSWLWQEESGQDLIEYGLLVALIALAAIAAMGNLATAISSTFASASSNLTSASS
jgi:pilus assembly protein Flp/PilA